jgi:hypothetical protein
MMRYNRNSEAARRFAERRTREDNAPRLHHEVPELLSLDLSLSESKESTSANVEHVRRVVVASAPAYFEVPCTDPSCNDGGHDLTQAVMHGLRQKSVSFEGEDACFGSTGAAACGRVLHFRATASYSR